MSEGICRRNLRNRNELDERRLCRLQYLHEHFQIYHHHPEWLGKSLYSIRGQHICSYSRQVKVMEPTHVVTLSTDDVSDRRVVRGVNRSTSLCSIDQHDIARVVE